jgi:hypothetical protein
MGEIDIDSKDLPDIKPVDIKADISVVTAMDAKTLEMAKTTRGLYMLSNKRLIELLEYYPLAIARDQIMYDNRPKYEGDGIQYLETIDRMKEKYGLVIKEIETRKAKANIDVK